MTSFRSGCPIASTLDIVGDRWSLAIIRSMVMGATSYSDLLSAPERISTNILADRLRKMEAAGLIEQAAIRRGATHGAYRLTVAGADLLPALQAIARWGERHLPDRWTAPESFYAARAQDLIR